METCAVPARGMRTPIARQSRPTYAAAYGSIVARGEMDKRGLLAALGENPLPGRDVRLKPLPGHRQCDSWLVRKITRPPRYYLNSPYAMARWAHSRSSAACSKEKEATARLWRAVAKRWLAGVDETENYEFAVTRPQTTPQPTKMRKRDRDRAERLRLAGGSKPSLRDRAVALANERGVVRTRDLTDIGVPRCYLARMCEEGLLIKVGYGLYRAPDREAA